MTWVFTERDLQITISNAEDARRFDDPDNHRLTHCMKAVDFIIELSDRVLFIEFKDPQHPQATQEARQEFVNSFQSGNLDEELKYKYRDSLLYEWAVERVDKPIYFMVLIAIDTLTAADLDKRTNDLKRKLPVQKPASWTRPISQDCGVFNLALWNASFPDFQVSRLSSQA